MHAASRRRRSSSRRPGSRQRRRVAALSGCARSTDSAPAQSEPRRSSGAPNPRRAGLAPLSSRGRLAAQSLETRPREGDRSGGEARAGDRDQRRTRRGGAGRVDRLDRAPARALRAGRAAVRGAARRARRPRAPVSSPSPRGGAVAPDRTRSRTRSRGSCARPIRSRASARAGTGCSRRRPTRLGAQRLAERLRARGAILGEPSRGAAGGRDRHGCCPEDGRDAPALAAHADVGLYAARAAGRSLASSLRAWTR